MVAVSLLSLSSASCRKANGNIHTHDDPEITKLCKSLAPGTDNNECVYVYEESRHSTPSSRENSL